jgi:hypothetical protein
LSWSRTVVSHVFNQVHQCPYHWSFWSLFWLGTTGRKFATQPNLCLPIIIKSYLLSLWLEVPHCLTQLLVSTQWIKIQVENVGKRNVLQCLQS